MLRCFEKPIVLASLLFTAVLAFLPATSNAESCSQPLTEGSGPTVRDCIYIARSSIGAEACGDCVCDVNGSGGVSVSDALRCLWFVVGGDVTLDCPPCDPSTTTTVPACASCSEVFFHTAAEEELCESSRLIYEAMIDCPCEQCADECAGFCQTDSAATLDRSCPRCVFESCHQAVSDCVED